MLQHCKLVRRLFFVFSTLAEPLDAKERQSPSPGSTVELGFLGSVLHVELPLSPDSQQLAETSTFDVRFNPSVHVGTPTSCLPAFCLTHTPCSSSHPPDRSTHHQYTCSRHRWRICGRCGNAWCCVSPSWFLDHLRQ